MSDQVDMRPYNMPTKLLLAAGPVNCSYRVLRALSMPAVSPVDKHGLVLFNDCREMLKKVFCTKNKLTFAQQTSGTGGLEAAILNCVAPNETLVVAVLGTWGDRVAEMGDNNHLKTVRLSIPVGEVYTQQILEDAVKKHRPKMLFVTHGETSTGVLQPLEGLADMCHKYDCLLAVDAIITIGCERLLVDEWNLDVAVGASQKGMGMPPGFAFLTFSPRAEKIVRSRTHPVPLYLDVMGVAHNFNCFGEYPGYFYTFSTNMMGALRESLCERLEEGMENLWARHKRVAEYMWKNMESIGVKQFITKRENRLHCVGCYVLPQGINWMVLLDHIYDKYDISLSFGIGPSANLAIRIGLMAVNATENMADHVKNVLVEAMAYLKSNKLEEPQKRFGGIYVPRK